MRVGPTLRRFDYWHEAVLAVLLLALMAVAAVTDPAFVQVETQLLRSYRLWTLALLAVPMTMIIITGGIDLSIGAAMGLCAVVFGLAVEAGMGLVGAVGAAIAVGLAAGAVNGLFIVWTKVHPLIITLATLSAYRGIAEGMSGGRSFHVPEGLAALGGTAAGLPWGGWIVLVAAAWAAVMLVGSATGRSLYAIGHNETAARYSGIGVGRLKVMVYTLAGLAAAGAALLDMARYNRAKADVGMDMELNVITVVVLGGTSIFGGRGRIVGTILAVLLIHQTREYMSWRGATGDMIRIIVGMILIVSVLLNVLLSPRTRER